MKQYNPKSKKWETLTEQAGSLKKPDLCKGKRPHNFVLVLPWYAKLQDGAPDLTPEQTEAYYEFEDGRVRAEKRYDGLQECLGIRASRGWKVEVTRYFVCTNCGKKQ